MEKTSNPVKFRGKSKSKSTNTIYEKSRSSTLSAAILEEETACLEESFVSSIAPQNDFKNAEGEYFSTQQKQQELYERPQFTEISGSSENTRISAVAKLTNEKRPERRRNTIKGESNKISVLNSVSHTKTVLLPPSSVKQASINYFSDIDVRDQGKKGHKVTVGSRSVTAAPCAAAVTGDNFVPPQTTVVRDTKRTSLDGGTTNYLRV